MGFVDSGVLSSFGVGMDLIGAFFLSQSLFIKNLDKTIIEASDYMNGNPYRLKSAIYQRIDAITGFIFLALGFFFQFIANLNFIPKGENDILSLTITLLVLLALLAWSITGPIKRDQSRKSIIETFLLRTALELTSKSSMKTKDQFLEAAKFYGEAIGIKPENNERAEQYAERILTEYRSE
jgi:hypothetical protein